MIWSGKRKNTIVRDSLHGLTNVDSKLLAVLDTPAFQRLRWIHQNGLAFLVFPGAEHSRFSHSLGSYHVAQRVFTHLQALARDFALPLGLGEIDDDLQKAFLMAALCHDLGHTAFSHVFEPMLLPDGLTNHEDCTIAILQNPDDALKRAIEDWCELDQVIDLLEGNHISTCFCQLLAGTSDVDRWDYLLRDARATGVRYGVFDLDWMIHTLLITLNEAQRPILLFDGRRGPIAMQQFLLARRYMYRQVYFHATIRAAEMLLRSIFERAFALEWVSDDHGYVPPALRHLVDRLPPSQEDFLETDDVLILHAIRGWARASSIDPVLKYLCNSFVARQLPKEVLLPQGAATDEAICEEVINITRSYVAPFLKEKFNDFSESDLDTIIDHFVLVNRCPYPPSDLENTWFECDGAVVPASRLPEGNERIVDQPFSITRLYVPAGVRDQVQHEITRQLT